MANTVQVLAYSLSFFFRQDDGRLSKPAGPKIWIPFETALLVHLGEQVRSGEFEKDDALYNQAYRRIKDNPDLLIYWICKSTYEEWKNLMSVPDCKIIPEDTARWEDGWSDPQNWNIEDYPVIDGQNVITHDRKMVKPIGRITPDSHPCVYSMPNPQDANGMYNLAIAYSNGDSANFISLGENYIYLPLLQELPQGGYRPGAELVQVTIALYYHIEQQQSRHPSVFYEKMLAALTDFWAADQGLRNERIAATQI